MKGDIRILPCSGIKHHEDRYMVDVCPITKAVNSKELIFKDRAIDVLRKILKKNVYEEKVDDIIFQFDINI
jgi:hypothetical protein